MNSQYSAWDSFVKSPLLWGGVLTFGFYAMIHKGIIVHPQIVRYFASHPVEYVITGMFVVGLVAMVLRYLDVVGEQQSLRQHRSPLESRGDSKRSVASATDDINAAQEFAAKHGASTYTQRLLTALGFVQRNSNAAHLDDELRYLADDASVRMDGSYALVRMILWAVPMLGFLGTVVGITLALGNLDLAAINESSKKLSAGLSVAFDTTALAIALDIFLYFIQFVTHRQETLLLRSVEDSVGRELQGRYENESTTESELATVRRMLELAARNLESILLTQSEVWGRAANDLTERSSQLAVYGAQQIQDAISATLTDAQATLAIKLQDSLYTSLDAVASLQSTTMRQTELLNSLTGSACDLVSLEERINHNLGTLAQVGQFEETLNTLAAVIHLLSGKVPQLTALRAKNVEAA